VNSARDLRYRLEAAAVRSLMRAVSVLPTGPAIGWGNALGWLAFRLWTSRRRIAIDNLVAAGVCADKPSASRIALESFRTFTVMLIEAMILRCRFTRETWAQHVTLQGSQSARKLLETPGQALLLASAHIGNWEAGIHIASLIRPVVMVHRPLSNPYLQKVAYEERAGDNVSLLSSLDPDPFRFLEVLAAGKIVALMTDQHAATHRTRVNFFGRPAWTTETVAMMHLYTRVPLISAFCIRTGPLQYEVHLTEPLRFKRTGNRAEDARQITQMLTDEVETIARRFPGQYMWGHRRWKP
jgi:KDO2-lipid IV(A) lauroyltransferase